MSEIIQGFAGFERNLKELELSQSRAVLTKAAKAGAQIATDALKRAAPKLSGFLERKITARTSGKESDANEVTVEIKPGKAFYWYFTNSGTRTISATHWADRAIESVTERIREAMRAAMIEAIQKVVR